MEEEEAREVGVGLTNPAANIPDIDLGVRDIKSSVC
jgi:hypothetical protein